MLTWITEVLKTATDANELIKYVSKLYFSFPKFEKILRFLSELRNTEKIPEFISKFK